MSVELKKRLLTVEEYHIMIEAGIFTEDDKLELLNGEIVYMSPGKNPHIGCVNKLNAFLNRRIGHKAIISVQNPIGLGEYSEPEPDLAVCRLKDDFYSTEKARPEEIYLIIEVADTSLQKDREIKLPIYAQAGIPIYWIVNLIDKQVEVYSRPEEGLYKLRELKTLKDKLDLEALGLEMPVSEILA